MRSLSWAARWPIWAQPYDMIFIMVNHTTWQATSSKAFVDQLCFSMSRPAFHAGQGGKAGAFCPRCNTSITWEARVSFADLTARGWVISNKGLSTLLHSRWHLTTLTRGCSWGITQRSGNSRPMIHNLLHFRFQDGIPSPNEMHWFPGKFHTSR